MPFHHLRVLDRQIFTSSGTWTKPTTFRPVLVHIRGIGGGGGGGSANNGGGGGGGGSWCDAWYDPDDLGATVTVTRGAGGAGVAALGGTGSAGGTSSFGAHITCPGGNAGAGAIGAAAAAISTLDGNQIVHTQSGGPPGINGSVLDLTNDVGGNGGWGPMIGSRAGEGANDAATGKTATAGLNGGGGGGGTGSKDSAAGGNGGFIVDTYGYQS